MEQEAVRSRLRSASAGRIRPRRSWPGMRALLGGALLTLAAAGLWWSYTLSQASPSTQYIVAVTDIAPGTVVTSDHVGLQAIDLPNSIAAEAFGSSQDAAVLGAIAVNVVRAGEILSASDVRPTDAVQRLQSRFEVSLEIDLPRALNGLLQPGEFVDVVATHGTGTSALTNLIAIDALVLALGEPGGEGLGLGAAVVSLGLETEQDVLNVVAAHDQGLLTLVRPPITRPAKADDVSREPR